MFLISFNVGNGGEPKIRKITICRHNSTKSGKTNYYFIFSTNNLNRVLLQVYFLRMEISDFPIQISAAGFLDIDCQLVPKVITFESLLNLNSCFLFVLNIQFVGTTLSYLIILYQFDSEEGRSYN